VELAVLPVAREAGSGDDRPVRVQRQPRVDQHPLGGSLVERFDEDLRFPEDASGIRAGHPHGVYGVLRERVDRPQVLAQGIHLPAADLPDEVLLPVQVGCLDAVEVGDDEPAHPRPGQRDGDVGAQPAGAGDAHGARSECGEHLRVVFGEEVRGEKAHFSVNLQSPNLARNHHP
jgi:hypothetical protein